MAKKFRFLLVLSIPVALLFFSNCKKDQFSTAPLAFSNDTLTFDTVFTTLGSTTQYFKIYNRSKNPVKIDVIQLMHLPGTQFRINVDGIPDTSSTGILKNVQIPAKDSIYVFVEVTVNPNSLNAPFVIIDNVNFTVGSHTQKVVLQAFGQNAYFHYAQIIKHDTQWQNDKPHVIIGRDSIPGVLVNCGATLTINPGCQIFLANNSAIFVEGSLKAEASDWHDSIVFRGVRLESYYDDLPGQWFGIVFLRNGGCTPSGSFSHCVINESSYGIYAGAGLTSNLSDYSGTIGPMVTINNTIIKNSQFNAVYGFNARITANNSLFYASGDDLIKLGLGGTYNFTQCTMYNTGSFAISHQQPTLLLSNFAADGNFTQYPAPLNASFTNCVIYGNLLNEISFNRATNTSYAFNDSFINCLLQTPSDTLALFATNNHNLFNQNPLFKNPQQNDFTPSDTVNVLSPLIDYAPTGLAKDIWDNGRPILLLLDSSTHPYDIGAIERQQQ